MKRTSRPALWASWLLVLFAPLLAQPQLGEPRVMQGPMLGTIAQDSVTVWLRLSATVPVVLEYGRDPWLQDSRRTAPVTATSEADRTVRVTLDGLAPGTDYYYRVWVAGKLDKYLAGYPPFRMRTAPAPGARTRTRIAFGSCYRLQASAADAIWQALPLWEPDVFLWLGDNIYGDSTDPAVLAEEYRRIHEVPALQPILRSVPQLAIWDDHDFGLNNHDRSHPAKAAALRVFQHYWPNPAYGLPDTPGVFFQFSYGGMDVFMLDCRYHRAPNKSPASSRKTMLGEGQLRWLKDALRRSRAPFKVLACGSGWSLAKGSQGDSWAAFLAERDALFDFIRDEKISGVVLLSGDTHMGEFNVIPWSQRGGYDLYELVSSPLAQTPGQGWVDRTPEIRIRQAYSGSPNFGVIECDLTRGPVLRLLLVDDRGRAVWEPVELRPEDLKNGSRTWRDKLDPLSRERQERAESGGPYYR